MTRKGGQIASRRRTKNRTAAFRGFTPGKVKHFYDAAFDFGRAEFEDGEEEGSVITKQALVMIEGTHIDSAKRKHQFPAERIQRIVANTNALLASGGRIPWQRDHQKTQSANIGDLDGPLEIRVITRKDLPHKGLGHLIGKVGAFATRLIAKGADVVKEVLAGRIKTLSPGIDVEDDIIREISATPTPAIVGLSTFRRGEDREARRRSEFTALTFDDMEAEIQDMDAVRGDFDALSNTFWELISSINEATEDELQGEDPTALQMQALDDYSVRIQALIGLNVQPGDPAADPAIQQQGQVGQVGYSAFTLDGVERDLRLAEFRRSRRDRGRKRGKRVRSALLGETTTGRVARVGVLGAAGLGAIALARRGKRPASPGVFTPNQTSAGQTVAPKARGNPNTSARKPNPYRRGRDVGNTVEAIMQNGRPAQRAGSGLANAATDATNAARRRRGLNQLPSARGTRGPNSGYRKKKR